MNDIPESIRVILQAIHRLRESAPRVFYSPMCDENQIIVAEPDALWTNETKVIIVNPVHRALISEHRPDVQEFVPSGKVMR